MLLLGASSMAHGCREEMNQDLFREEHVLYEKITCLLSWTHLYCTYILGGN